jgi:hypothetical protein
MLFDDTFHPPLACSLGVFCSTEYTYVLFKIDNYLWPSA